MIIVINGRRLWTRTRTTRPHVLPGANRSGREAAARDQLHPDRHAPASIEVRPIRGLAGDHEVNEVFIDDAIAPSRSRG